MAIDNRYFVAENFNEYKKIIKDLSDIEENLASMYNKKMNEKTKNDQKIRYWSKTKEERDILDMSEQDVDRIINNERV